MKAELNISLTYQLIVSLVKQLPKQQKINLAKELEKEAIFSKLSYFLESFKTNELSQDVIDQEVEAVRQELYDRLN